MNNIAERNVNIQLSGNAEGSLMKRLEILASAAKYDVSCASSGVDRGSQNNGGIGNAVKFGICHSFSADGRCVSLLKILQTNDCIFDCKYCSNRCSNDVERASLSPREVADLTINFYKRNYIEGLFLSSAIVKNPDFTMEMLYNSVRILRQEYKFNGYIHVKAIPGADPILIEKTGLIADRMSVNIELPSEASLKKLAPNKNKDTIIKPMKNIRNRIIENKNEIALFNSTPKFVPGGQSTQLIVGATPDNDKKIITLSESLYNKLKLKRVYYSAFIRVNDDSNLPALPEGPPLLREHRLYQADWLLRFYGFKAEELLTEDNPNFNIFLDPKCDWALRNIGLFPVEVNKADMMTLLRVPGIGRTSAKRIIQARRTCRLDFKALKKIGVVLKRAAFFITCEGRMMYKHDFNSDFILANLLNQKGMMPKEIENFNEVKVKQLSLFSDSNVYALPDRQDVIQSIVGEM